MSCLLCVTDGWIVLVEDSDAIEGADVMLYGVSLAYKESANCRLEANYAHQQELDMIPLMMSKDFKPKGWLGLILGTRLEAAITSNRLRNSPRSQTASELIGEGQLAVKVVVLPRGRARQHGRSPRRCPSGGSSARPPRRGWPSVTTFFICSESTRKSQATAALLVDSRYRSATPRASASGPAGRSRTGRSRAGLPR